jgi:hypothetical protein
VEAVRSWLEERLPFSFQKSHFLLTESRPVRRISNQRALFSNRPVFPETSTGAVDPSNRGKEGIDHMKSRESGRFFAEKHPERGLSSNSG